MAETALFTTAQDIIDNVYSRNTVDPNTIKDTFIEISQEKYIRPLLGNDLYDRLYAIIEGGGSFTGDDLELVDDFLIPCLRHYVKYEVTYEQSIGVAEKGAFVNQSQFGRPSSVNERTTLLKTILGQAEALADKLTRWIEDEDQSGKFEDYYRGRNIRNRVNTSSGIIMSRTHRTCHICRHTHCTCSDD